MEVHVYWLNATKGLAALCGGDKCFSSVRCLFSAFIEFPLHSPIHWMFAQILYHLNFNQACEIVIINLVVYQQFSKSHLQLSMANFPLHLSLWTEKGSIISMFTTHDFEMSLSLWWLQIHTQQVFHSNTSDTCYL